MHLMYFTEQPMSAYPEDEGRKRGATALMFSNRHFDAVADQLPHHTQRRVSRRQVRQMREAFAPEDTQSRGRTSA